MKMVSSSCIPNDALSLYVMGALDGAQQSRVERHVLECAACAAGLTREATVEMAMYELAAANAGATEAATVVSHAASVVSWAPRQLVVPTRRRSRWMAPVLSACAAAALVLVINAWSGHNPSASTRSATPDLSSSTSPSLDGGYPG